MCIATQQATHTLTIAGSHVVNSMAITPDNQYLIYTTGILFNGDLITTDGSTTIGVISANDLSAVTVPFVYSYNDNLTPQHLMIDQIIFYTDNLLNTQPTSHEFMMLGTIIIGSVPG